MKQVQLRKYQHETISETNKSIREGFKRILWVLPCGAGKTTVAAAYILWCVTKGKKVLIFVHRKNLVLQFGQRLYKQFKIVCGVIMGKTKTNYNLSVQVASVDTLKNRKKPHADIIFIDEAHIGIERTKKILEAYDEKTIIIGLTATPFRGDGKGLGVLFQKIIHKISVRELIQMKNLVPTNPVKISNIDFTGIKVNRSLDGSMEYNQKQMLELFKEPKMLNAFIDRYKKSAWGFKTLTFCINVKHAKMMSKFTNENGIPSAYMDGSMKQEERDKIMKNWGNGKIWMVHSVGLFREGLDMTSLKCVCLLKAFLSLGDYVQSTSRGTRPHLDKNYEWVKNEDGSYYKEDCLVLDAGGNTERHGYVEDYDQIPFDLIGKNQSKGETKVKCCPECEAYSPIQAKICVPCGYAYTLPSDEEELSIDGGIEFEAVDKEELILRRLKKISHNEVHKKVPSSQLRIYALLKGFKSGWWYHKAIDFGYVKGVNKDHPSSFQVVRTILMVAEIHSETHELYQRIKKEKKIVKSIAA